ncbi:methylenetetrahydrofolate reductase-domain-containing protein [Collybia nuda]|uniref:Methylenetetrahydrofolate reductase-domain-containing protein n=1 Tax=Collybia nuda TaxID=64659 RepID=A0A9P5YHD2_9AGAR|nr:methylenetetrahydrofolate reductase-domain-containing protein [Collybia nuda]
MKLSDKIAAHKSPLPFFTFEFFPPRTDQGFENLLARISRLCDLNPLAISVTWGAGGSTKERSLDLAGLTQAEYDMDTVMHLTCTNMEEGMVNDALKAAKERGIQNILALRGDPPRGEEEWIPIDPRFQHGIDLVKHIRSSSDFSSEFCIGVAAYPDGHPDSTVDEDTEISRLKEKVDAGADFVATQFFYDVDKFIQWVEKVRQKGILVPIIPSIMPIQTYSSFLRLTKLCGTRVPEQIMADLAPISHDDQLVKDYGVKLATEMIQRLTKEGGIRGVQFCTLNLEKSVHRILELLQWTGITAPIHNKLISETPGVPTHPPSGVDMSGLVVSPSTATTSATLGLAQMPATEGEAGRGELNNAATWDDFPNGRFGDFKSPAFGNQDPWGNPTIGPRGEALEKWGNPKSLDDLTQLFLDHLHSKISTTPFSPVPLSPESLMILTHLERLTKRGWWTVGSQPAVDAVSSSDKVVGWGPRAGYVFQKGFVEFFCEEADVNAIERRVEQRGNGWVHWFAGDNKGECRGNVPENERNAVTWGVFPGQEIAQTTIIEKESFLSWKDEAFSIWSDWASFYRPDSEERNVLESVKNKRWLVSIVHHDYKDPQALWSFLFDGDEWV